MPPVDLETLLCGRGDSKVACESKLFVSSFDDPVVEDPDLPPESIQVPIHDEIRWEKLNKVFDRGESTIGNANPKSSRSSSKPKTGFQRLNAGGAIKPNGSIIGLPSKIQRSGFRGSSPRQLPTLRIFPLKLTIERFGDKKPAVPEPGSPKVSCFGNVLSEREKKLCRRSSVVADEEEVAQVARCWAGLASIFRGLEGEIRSTNSTPVIYSEEGEKTKASTAEATAPELQGMNRYSSRRRSSSWVDDVDIASDGHVFSLEPLDRECALRQS